MTWEELQKVNENIATMDIKGKDYAAVPERIKAFRRLCPNGSIETELASIADGVCVFRAVVKDENGKTLGTGTAYEKENSSYINKTSYIENCETSAVGRALGMCGIGIDTSVASFEEVANARLNQNTEPKPTVRGEDLPRYVAKPVSAPEYTCAGCTAKITEAEHNYSTRKYGRALCRACQKNA